MSPFPYILLSILYIVSPLITLSVSLSLALFLLSLLLRGNEEFVQWIKSFFFFFFLSSRSSGANREQSESL
jgi:hypothetical protein